MADDLVPRGALRVEVAESDLPQTVWQIVDSRGVAAFRGTSQSAVAHLAFALTELHRTLPCGHPAACGDPCGWCQVLMKLRAIVCAVDCGGSYAKAIEAVRELVPEMKP